MLKQYEPLKSGDTVVTISTTLGDIKIKMFPEFAPKAVENFTTHAKNGYYDSVIFHRVINDFMIQGGDPDGVGTGGESIWGEPFEDEFTNELHNFYGALSMANAGPCTNSSQFFIVQAKNCPAQMIEQMADLKDYFSEECAKKYAEVGGTPWLDYHHTVFGQVIEGMDTVEKIAAVEVNSSDKPIEDVVIKSMSVGVTE
ncbi:MAG: peptidylprolyl isomerase [Acutalibacteraceae bacterium]|nr:peptidylprolyl isomerase [Acutalibacteraceae bacterium]